MIKDRENGLLVDFFSTDEIVERVDEVLSHPDQLADVRKMARTTVVERYNLKSKGLPQQLALVRRVCSGKAN